MNAFTAQISSTIEKLATAIDTSREAYRSQLAECSASVADLEVTVHRLNQRQDDLTIQVLSMQRTLDERVVIAINDLSRKQNETRDLVAQLIQSQSSSDQLVRTLGSDFQESTGDLLARLESVREAPKAARSEFPYAHVVDSRRAEVKFWKDAERIFRGGPAFSPPIGTNPTLRIINDVWDRDPFLEKRVQSVHLSSREIFGVVASADDLVLRYYLVAFYYAARNARHHDPWPYHSHRSDSWEGPLQAPPGRALVRLAVAVNCRECRARCGADTSEPGNSAPLNAFEDRILAFFLGLLDDNRCA